MTVLYTALTIVGVLLVSYLLGSFPSAIFIGKVFYGVDVRQVGSHNAGGTNVGRVIGKKAGLITIGLDVFKTIAAIWVCFFAVVATPLHTYLAPGIASGWYYYLAGIGAAVGHSFPIFARFKGGKAMSVYAGFVLGTNFVFAALGVSFFFLIFFWKRYVSLSSILSVLFVAVLSIFPAAFPVLRFGNWWFGPRIGGLEETFVYTVFLFLLAGYVIARHHTNIKRLLKGEEPTTRFKKTPPLKKETAGDTSDVK